MILDNYKNMNMKQFMLEIFIPILNSTSIGDFTIGLCIFNENSKPIYNYGPTNNIDDVIDDIKKMNDFGITYKKEIILLGDISNNTLNVYIDCKASNFHSEYKTIREAFEYTFRTIKIEEFLKL